MSNSSTWTYFCYTTGPWSAGDKTQPGGPVHRGLHHLQPMHRQPQGLSPLHYGPCHWHPCGIMPKLPPARHMLCQLSMGIYSSHPERPGATVDDYIHHSTPAITIASHHDITTTNDTTATPGPAPTPGRT